MSVWSLGSSPEGLCHIHRDGEDLFIPWPTFFEVVDKFGEATLETYILAAKELWKDI